MMNTCKAGVALAKSETMSHVRKYTHTHTQTCIQLIEYLPLPNFYPKMTNRTELYFGSLMTCVFLLEENGLFFK